MISQKQWERLHELLLIEAKAGKLHQTGTMLIELISGGGHCFVKEMFKDGCKIPTLSEHRHDSKPCIDSFESYVAAGGLSSLPDWFQVAWDRAMEEE